MLARDAHRRARALLSENRKCLDDLAANALERETLSREDMEEIFAAHRMQEEGGAETVGETTISLTRGSSPPTPQ